MNNLKVVEKDGLIKIYETNTGEKVVYGRELYEGLNINTRYNDWIKNRINKYDFVENLDYTTLTENLVNGGKQNVHILKLDTAKEIAMVENNELGRQYRKYFIEIEKKYKDVAPKLDNLSPQLQLLINLELKQNQLETAITTTNERIDNIKDVVALDTTSWRTDTKNLIVKIAYKIGGNAFIQDVRKESYKLLNARMGVDIGRRLTNKRRRMADEGATKSKRDKLNYLDVITDDKKLIEGYTAIIKEMAIKYGAA